MRIASERLQFPATARSGSPTLTEPDRILPGYDSVSISSPKQVRPPSPSYLLEQRYHDHHKQGDPAKNGRQIDARQRTAQRARDVHTPENVVVLQASPAKHAEYRYSDIALGSSPTVGNAVLSVVRKASLIDSSRKNSAASSAENSDDWEAIRMPSFVGRTRNGEDWDETDTLDDADLDSATPSERWHAGDQIEPPEAEESAVTLMRAEMILANAKRRLNLMDQNLRGAREMVVPLTAANLRRISSPATAYSQSARYTPESSTDLKSSGDAQRHYRVFSDPTVPTAYQGRGQTSMGRTTIPINTFTPSWTSNPMRASRSPELVKSGGESPRAIDGLVGPALAAVPESEPAESKTASSRPGTVRSRPSAANLREQMDELKGRISLIKERAREDSLRRRSMQSLRQSSNPALAKAPTMQPNQHRSIDAVANGLGPAFSPTKMPAIPTPPETDDGELVFDPALGYAALSPRGYAIMMKHNGDDDRGTAPTVNEDAPKIPNYATFSEVEESPMEYAELPAELPAELSALPRHEDRDDAFDYSNFFLHSSLGTFSRPRSASITSTDSGATARGPSVLEQAPPTPETPAALRDIERNIHNANRSSESLATDDSFATAQEDVRGRVSSTPVGEWMAPRSHVGHLSTALETEVVDQTTSEDVQAVEHARRSQMGSRMSTNTHRESRMSHRMSSRMSNRMSSRLSQHTFPSIPPSATSIAVSALIDPNGRRLGLKDKALVYTVLENVRQICEKLQTEDEMGSTIYLLRQRLEDARKVLDGSTTRLGL